MNRGAGRRTGWCSLALLLGVGAFGPLQAQDPRAGDVARAFEEFDTGRRVQLLTTLLDPSIGPTHDPWASGVQLLAQTLIEEGNDSLAGIYLRWAVRRAPDFKADTVQFLPEVGAEMAEAHAFVQQSSSAADDLVETSWQWPAQGGTSEPGKLQVSAPSVTALQASVEGTGPVTPDQPITLAPGSYRLTAAAPGYESLAVTREVLPGVTTVLLLRPSRTAVAAQPTPEPSPPPAAVIEPESKKKFPWLLVVGGAVAAGAVVALAAGGGSEEPTTGTIEFTFPNP
ncbi:MAG TPA: hypothetical protein VH680_06090 [Gemmatimonadales bacterium]|jgi:hypothetical protein